MRPLPIIAVEAGQLGIDLSLKSWKNVRLKSRAAGKPASADYLDAGLDRMRSR